VKSIFNPSAKGILTFTIGPSGNALIDSWIVRTLRFIEKKIPESRSPCRATKDSGIEMFLTPAASGFISPNVLN